MNWNDHRPDDAMDGSFAPYEGPLHIPTVAPPVLREAMARLGAAVHVITTAGPGGITGFTATAVCSVSDQPATLLVCVNRRAQSAPVVSANGVFCVNTMAAGQEPIADFFAKRTADKAEAFKSADWITLTTGSPVLASSVVAFDCRISEMKPVASHTVIFGLIEAVHQGPIGPALVYHDRAYKPI